MPKDNHTNRSIPFTAPYMVAKMATDEKAPTAIEELHAWKLWALLGGLKWFARLQDVKNDFLLYDISQDLEAALLACLG